MKKHIFLLLLALMLLAGHAMALEQTEDLTGEKEWADGETVRYTYTYSYPQFAETLPGADVINNWYRFVAEDMQEFATPIYGEMAKEAGLEGTYTRVKCEIVSNTKEYLCVAVWQEQDLGEGARLTLTGQTFGLAGADAGTVTSLMEILGVEEEALPEIEEKVYALTYLAFPEADREDVLADFWPEEDFLLLEDGTIRFYYIAGTVAPIENGFQYMTVNREQLVGE